MLKQLIADGFGQAEDYNCAEKIIRGANEAYGLNLSEEGMKLAGGFGGGLAIESTCGALCGAVMALSHLLIDTIAHQSQELKPMTQELLEGFQAEMGSIYCDALKNDYRTPEKKCQVVIEKAAEHLDKLVSRIQEESQVEHQGSN